MDYNGVQYNNVAYYLRSLEDDDINGAKAVYNQIK
jgi:hypothetical protein